MGHTLNLKPLYFNKHVFWPFLLVLIIICYWPALHGPFVFDDQVNILENPAIQVNELSFDALKRAMFSNESGELKRLLPALSFGLNYYQAQGFSNTVYFKVTNLAIHLINSLLVFSLVTQLVPKIFQRVLDDVSLKEHTLFFAFFITIFWALHPLQVSTVAYIVQRMATLASLFMLLGLNAYVYARQRLISHPYPALTGMFLAIVFGTGLGLLCKENAALLILYCAAIEFTLFADQPHPKKILIFYALLLGLPALVVLYLMGFTDKLNLLAGYYSRSFTLEQRLLTELRVLWFYLQMLVWPDIRVMGLYHDDLIVSKSWFDPISTLWSGLAWLSALAAALWYRTRIPCISFAIVWYLLGHSMESSFLPLEIVYEHRNYLPILGFICLFAFGLVAFIQRWATIRQHLVTLTVLGLFTLVFCTLTFERAMYWESEESLFRSLAENNPRSPISLYSYAELLNKQKHRLGEAYQYYLKAVTLNKDSASLQMQATLAAAPNTTEPLLNPEKLTILLSKRHLIPWDLAVLDDASRCTLAQYPQCALHIQDVRRWLHAAIENNSVNINWRRTFIKSLYDMEMLYGMPEEALKTVIQAQTNDDRVFQYYLMKAEALLAVGRQNEAMSVINTAEELAKRFNPKLLNDIYPLKKRIENVSPRPIGP